MRTFWSVQKIKIETMVVKVTHRVTGTRLAGASLALLIFNRPLNLFTIHNQTLSQIHNVLAAGSQVPSVP